MKYNNVIIVLVFFIFACVSVGVDTGAKSDINHIAELKGSNISTSELTDKMYEIRARIAKEKEDSVKTYFSNKISLLESGHKDDIERLKNESRFKAKRRIGIIAPLAGAAIGIVTSIVLYRNIGDSREPPGNISYLIVPVVGLYLGLGIADITGRIIGGETEHDLNKRYAKEINAVIVELNEREHAL